MKQTPFYILLLYLGCCSLSAHAATGIDSLLRVLSSSRLSENDRIPLLLALTSEYTGVDKPLAARYGNEAARLAQSSHQASLQAEAYHLLGLNEERGNNYDSAIYYYQLAIPLFDSGTDKAELATTLNERGISYENKGNYTEAFSDFLRALKIYETIGDKKGIANEYLNIGLIHYYKNEFERAAYYFKKALSTSQSIMYSNGIASALNNLGMNEKEQGRADVALEYFKKVLVMDQHEGDPAHIAYSINNVGTAYAMLEKHKDALVCYQQSAVMKYQVKDYIGLSNTFNNMAASLIKLADYPLARHYLDSSLLLTWNFGFRNNIQEVYQTFYELEFAQHNYEKALAYYKQYEAQKDSVELLENNIAISKMQAMYDLEKAKLQIDDQDADLEVAYYTRFVSLLALILMLVLCVYLYYNGKRIHRLNKLLNQQRDDLITAKEVAENASRIKSQFLSVVSHEIRTPLNAIIGVSNLLHEADVPPEHVANVNVLKTSSLHLLHLINDLLDLNKLEEGKMEADVEQMSIRKIAESIIKMFKVSASQKGIELYYAIDPRIQNSLMGDDIKLTQALTNLVGNAVKFTDAGFVRLNIVQMKSDATSSIVRFVVEDTGIGIKEADQQVIFDSFTQFNHHSKKYGGTGLGLSISKKLIEVMGGQIRLESKIGQGSVFSFDLEFFAQQKRPEDPVTPLLQSSHFVNKRILIAEDNAVNVFVLNQFLHKWGIVTEVAVNGEEVISLLHKQSFDLILMDVHMPVKDGITATKEIRSSAQPWSNIPIIAITASHEFNVKEDVINSGMNDYVIKPFKPEELFEKLGKQL